MAIRIEDLRVVRGGTEVLRGVSLTVAQGSVTGLLGPSGCGKSTLMRSIVGVQIVAGGTVEVLGLPAGSVPLRRRIGYVTQAPSVYGDLTVVENLRYFARVVDAGPDRVGAVLDSVGLAGFASRLTSTLSGGQGRACRSRARFSASPSCWFSTSRRSGSIPSCARSCGRCSTSSHDDGATLLVSSHVMDEAGECDQLLLMRDGALLEQSTPDELRRRTGQDDLAKAFLAIIEASEQDR